MNVRAAQPSISSYVIMSVFRAINGTATSYALAQSIELLPAYCGNRRVDIDDLLRATVRTERIRLITLALTLVVSCWPPKPASMEVVNPTIVWREICQPQWREAMTEARRGSSG